MRIQSLFYTEHLASYGFVVIAVDHPGSTFLDMATAADAESLIESFALRPNEVIREIEFVEALTAEGEIFEGVVDMERLAVTGHSFGGYTTAALGGARLNTAALRLICEEEGSLDGEVEDNQDTLCSLGDLAALAATKRGLDEVPEGMWEATTDSRIRAIVALAPWVSPIFDDEGLATITMPTMIMIGSMDQSTVPEPNAYRMYEDIESETKSLVTFENADHFIFADTCVDLFIQLDLFSLCSDPVWDMERAHDLTNHFATAFFRAILYEDVEAQAILDGAEVDFAGIGYAFDSAD
jgi:predicted dienelactone hydrolase